MIAARFWDDRAVADLPYQRGLLLAALWDDRMRRISHGTRDLDDAILKMKDDTDAHRPWTRHGAPANLQAVYAQLGGGDLSSDVARFVDKGAPVFLPADMFGDCATVEPIDAPTFERGFDTAATGARDGFVAGVDPKGPAYAAGLRNGMRIIKREGGRLGDPTAPVSYRIEDQGVVKTIAWAAREPHPRLGAADRAGARHVAGEARGLHADHGGRDRRGAGGGLERGRHGPDRSGPRRPGPSGRRQASRAAEKAESPPGQIRCRFETEEAFARRINI